jgi:hypothetical protein
MNLNSVSRSNQDRLLCRKEGIGLTNLYVEFGLCSDQVQRYFDLFVRNRVKVVIFEDKFKPRTKETVQDAVYFLGSHSS